MFYQSSCCFFLFFEQQYELKADILYQPYPLPPHTHTHPSPTYQAFSQVLTAVAGSLATALNVVLQYVSQCTQAAGLQRKWPVRRLVSPSPSTHSLEGHCQSGLGHQQSFKEKKKVKKKTKTKQKLYMNCSFLVILITFDVNT